MKCNGMWFGVMWCDGIGSGGAMQCNEYDVIRKCEWLVERDLMHLDVYRHSIRIRYGPMNPPPHKHQ